MPSMVPPGYTRGPILYMCPADEAHQIDRQLQYFWDDAGAYGARILLLALDDQGRADAARLHARLREWELDSVTIRTVSSRAEAYADHQPAIDAATGILLLVNAPLAAAQTIGGTPLAQAVRRANAHGKAVGAYGTGMTILSQHMIVPAPAHPTSRELFFAPGLGLVNRLAVDTPRADDAAPRLTIAVGCNPFLVAASLSPGAGIAVYPDTTLECFGAGAVTLVTGADQTGAFATEQHTLHARARYNFDAGTFQNAAPSDIPEDDGPLLTGF